MSDLRTRMAKVLWKTFQNTPPINATDDEWESWWNDSTQEEKALCHALADAVIREIDAEFLDFGLWLSEELQGTPISRIDLESCLADWKEYADRTPTESDPATYCQRCGIPHTDDCKRRDNT